MQSLRRKSLFAVVLTVAGLLFTTTAQAYSPGTATARKPTYSSSTGGFSWGCSFSGWRSGARVTWSCKLVSVGACTIGAPCPPGVIQTRSGAWTPSPTSYSTPNYFWPKSTGQPALCVDAYALSVDGGASQRRCNF